MRKCIAVFIGLILCVGVFAKNNSLVGVKVLPLPDNRARVDFRFSQKLTQLPASFITGNPPQLILDFIPADILLDKSSHSQKIDIGALKNYNIVAVDHRVRASLNISSTASYSGSMRDNIYTLLLSDRPVSGQEINPLDKREYTGKLISLNFQNIQIRAVLQLLAEFTGINMVVSEQVKGEITLRLNNTPWDQALDIILKTNSLDKRQMGNVMMIAPASELIKQEKDDYKSQVEVIGLSPLHSDLLQINYAKAADIATLLKDKTTSLLSKRGTLSVDVRTNSIWVQDTTRHIEKIRRLIKQLDVPVKQVLIEARIINVTKDFAEDLGIRFDISRPTHLNDTLRKPGVASANRPISERLNVDLSAVPGAASPASVGIALAKLGNGILLDLELSALESEGHGEIIATPRLITTNQQAAVIESGEEIPYQESTTSGATTVAFKKAVLSLKVTPQITPDNKIMMELQINQDTPSAQIFNGVPSILTREIQTKVLVNNGQTIVLGGIYKQDKRNSVNRVPFLGELPVVGALFRNQNITTKNEELLIFITPRIITNALSMTTVEERGVINLDKFGKRVTPWKQ